MIIPDKVLRAIEVDAEQAYPRESCGVIIIKKGRKIYYPCRNIAISGQDFAIHPEDYSNAEDQGEVIMIVHSHPNTSPQPTPADLIGCERSGLPWLIINYPTLKTFEFSPSGYVQPLYGREFNHGVVDCYTFVRDYYQQELGITLGDYEREDNWWLSGQSLYMEYCEDEGFYPVKDIQPNDLIFMTVASQVPNHAAVYIGDGQIAHHEVGRLSSRDIYGGWYMKITTSIMRRRTT